MTSSFASLTAVGNALVDLEFDISEALLAACRIPKATMQLASEAEQYALLQQLASAEVTPRKQSSGGSAANSAFAFSALGGNCCYISRVGNDALGQFYLQDLNCAGVRTQPQAISTGTTGTCIVLNTPDGERTMQTFLGASAGLSDAQIDIAPLQNDYVYIEGYLASSPSAILAVQTLRKHANAHHGKIALSLSDCSMIRFFKSGLLALIDTGVDILFCNETEALEFTAQSKLDIAIQTLHTISHLVIVTRGGQGAVISARHGQTIYAESKSLIPRDTNGAGDAFAGAFLYGLSQNHSLAQCALLANEIAGAVVQTLGARLAHPQYAQIRQHVIA